MTILQIARDWPDAELVRQSGADQARFDALVDRLSAIRQDLQQVIYLPKTLTRLRAEGFARTFDAATLRQAAGAVRVSDRVETVKDALVTSITGLYDGLSEWYRRVGEGRVETVKAIIEAERAVRHVSGIIVFDQGRDLDWRDEVSMPGYVGLAGLFSEMLGDSRFTCLAALSNEMYLSYDEEDPLPPRIADFGEEALMRHEVAESMYNLAVQGLDLSDDVLAHLRQLAVQKLGEYMPRLRDVHATRHGEFNRRVLRPLRKLVRKLDLGLSGERLLARLDSRNVHLHGLVQTFFGYALIAQHFRKAHVGQLEQVSGAQQKFFVVTMPSGSQRKQLMYDLTSRIVDEASLNVNLVIVSNWARTGWNVIQPNVLIDATATRNLTAWTQLRGRAIRALHTWTNDCYRLLVVLDGHDYLRSEGDDPDGTPEPATEERSRAQLYTDLLALFSTVAAAEMVERVDAHYSEYASAVDALTAQERDEMAIRLVRAHNKVTHIYEMVKAYGSGSQVTFDRSNRAWVRREAIAAKHWQEISVNPFTGEKLAGPGHAPLVYAQDPRNDLPIDLQQYLAQAIADSDEITVRGWMEIEESA